MNIFDKYIFTSDGTWFVNGSRVFMSYFNTNLICVYGIRCCEENEAPGYRNGQYRLDEEMCGLDEFYINDKHASEYTEEELQNIGVEYNKEVKKFSSDELNKIADEFMRNEVRRFNIEKIKDFREFNFFYTNMKIEEKRKGI